VGGHRGVERTDEFGGGEAPDKFGSEYRLLRKPAAVSLHRRCGRGNHHLKEECDVSDWLPAHHEVIQSRAVSPILW